MNLTLYLQVQRRKQFEPRSGPRPFANSLDPDQDRQNVGPDFDPDLLFVTLLLLF